MKVFEIAFSPAPLEMIMEANVFNVKDPYQGLSIVSFLNNYHDNFSTDEARQMWTKKLSKLLMNDERFLHALREVPQGAPEWAATAVANGELMFFMPSDSLKDNIDNLSHYLNALENDIVGKDADAKARAQREFQAFPKAAKLDDLITKANEYFSRGSHTEARAQEGMTKMFSTADGYTWWKLDTADAFKREGATLQNCIGSHWTKARTDSAKCSILVLRDPSQNSVVAARIKNDKHSLDEMKGKNNKPPVQKYMPSVQELISHFKLDVTGSAESDIRNTGYYYHNKKLYTKAQAIAALMPKTIPITTLSNGMKLVRVDFPRNVEDKAALATLYDMYSVGPGQYGMDRAFPNSIYEVRKDDGLPVITIIVDETEPPTISRVIRYPEGKEGQINTAGMRESLEHILENNKPAKKTNVVHEAINYILQQGLAGRIHEKLKRQLSWAGGIEWTSDERGATQGVSEIPAEKEIEAGKKMPGWKLYTGESAKKLAATLEKKYYGYGHKDSEKVKWEIAFLKRVEKLYTAEARAVTGHRGQDENKMIALAVDEKDFVVPFVVRGDSVERYGLGMSAAGEQEPKVVASIVALANKEGLKIPKTTRLRHGIGKSDKGEYSKDIPNVKAEKLKGDVPAKMWDFSGVEKANRLPALVSTVTTKIRANASYGTNAGKNDEFGLVPDLEKFAKGTRKVKNDYGRWAEKSDDEWSESDYQWLDKDIDKWFEDRFKGKVPNKVITARVAYGHDNGFIMNMLAKDNLIIGLDDQSKKHNWQTWDDFTKVADQLNSMAKANGFKFDRQATLRTKEFKVNSAGEIQSQEVLKREQIERMRAQGRYGKEGVDELPFENNWKLKRMTPEEQANWQRSAAESGARGEAWMLHSPDGATPGAFFVSNKKITQAFHTTDKQGADAPRWSADTRGARKKEGLTLPATKGASKALLPYMKAAADKFGWTVGGPLAIKERSRLTKSLRDLDSRYNGRLRRFSLNQQEKELVALGLADSRRVGSSTRITISDAGEKAVRTLDRDGTETPFTDLVKPKTIAPDFKMPEKKAPEPTRRRDAPTPAAAPRATRATRGGGATKSQQALDRFNEITNETGNMPTRGEFIALLRDEPFNMSAAGAQTYYYNTKKKAERANAE